MAASCAEGSALSGDGLEELDGLDNMELITFLESSFRRSEFIRVARILKAREESSKADAVKDLTGELSLREAAISELRVKHDSLEKELEAMRNKQTGMEESLKKRGVEFKTKIVEMEQKLMEEKNNYSTLKGRYERVELAKAEALRCCAKYSKNCASVEGQVAGMKTDYSALKAKEQAAEEKIKSLMEEVQKYKEEQKKLLQNKDMNRVLECDNRVLRNEIDGVKRKYLEIELKEVVARQDLLKQKKDCSRLEEQVTSMKSEYSALKAREQNVEERFEILRVEAKWREKVANDRIAELEVEVKELEYAKRMLSKFDAI